MKVLQRNANVCVETALIDEVDFFYVPTMSQYILNVMVADYCSIFSVNMLQMWLA